MKFNYKQAEIRQFLSQSGAEKVSFDQGKFGENRQVIINLMPAHPFDYPAYDLIMHILEKQTDVIQSFEKLMKTGQIAMLVPRGSGIAQFCGDKIRNVKIIRMTPEYPLTGSLFESRTGSKQFSVINWFEFYTMLLAETSQELTGIPVSLTVCDNQLSVRSLVPRNTKIKDIIPQLVPEIDTGPDKYIYTDHPFRGRIIIPEQKVTEATPLTIILFPKNFKTKAPFSARIKQMIWEPSAFRFSRLYSSLPVQLDTPCQKCLHCTTICPSRLQPFMLSALFRKERIKDATAYFPEDCVDCGLCTYVCPSGIPLLHHISQLKKELGISL